MKTGGTMNFLKRAGAILMVVAIFASSCNKYADDFKQLNTKLDGLAATVASITTISADVTALKASIASVATAVAAIPNPTASIATLTTNLAALGTKVDGLVTTIALIKTTGETSAGIIAGLKTDLAAAKKAIDDNNAAMNIKLAALAATDVDQSKVLTDLIAANTVLLEKIADNKTALDAITASLGTAQTSLDGLTAGQLAQATQASVDALKVLIDAQKAQLDVIYANTLKAVDGVTITGLLNIGGVLTANPTALTVAVTAVTYQWQSAATSTYTDIAGATSKTYTVVAGDLGKFIKVVVSGTGTYLGSTANSGAGSAAVAAQISLTNIGAIVSNTTPVVGPPFVVNSQVKAGTVTAASGTPTVSYQWQNCTTATGLFNNISGATSATYTPAITDAGLFLRVVATGTLAFNGVVSATTAAVINPYAITSPNFLAAIGNNLVTITLTDGTFIAPVAPAVITSANFTWAGVDAAILAAGVYTRVSSTVVTVQTATPLTTGAVNTVTVPTSSLATASTGVTAVASTVLALGDVVAPTYTTLAGQNLVTITLTGGTFKPNVAVGDFTFTGGDFAAIAGGTFTRTSSTTVTLGTVALAGSVANAVTVKASALQTQATSAAAVSSTVGLSVLSPAFSMVATNNAVTITLTNGTFKAPTALTFAQNVSQSDLIWAGTDAAALAAATVTYTSSTTLVITNIASPYAYVGINNTVTVKPSAIATVGVGVLSVAAVPSTGNVALTSPVFSSTAGSTSLVITLTGGASFRTGLNATDFTFTGTNASRWNAGTGFALSAGNTVCTITTANTTVLAIDGVVTVKQAALTTGVVGTGVTVTN